jgi:G3E family GTPase
MNGEKCLEHVEEEQVLPITIVTGFLGAGKTTLLTEIIRGSKNKRIAVIQNEVSEEMGIESAVLTDSSGKIIPDFFELPNGCICCSAKNDMILALENIVSLGRERIDAVVVETTGIADPCSVAETFWVDSAVGSSVRLDGIVGVVDCVNFQQILQEDQFLNHGDVGRRQVAVSDRILLNKTDLASPEQLEAVRSLVRDLNPSAELIETCRSKVDVSWVLNIGSFSSERNLSQFSRMQHTASSVDHIFMRFPAGDVLKPRDVELWLGRLLWESGLKIYRSKGLFRSEQGKWYLAQSVGALFECAEVPAADQIDENADLGDAKFLFIGKDLLEKDIRSYLDRE